MPRSVMLVLDRSPFAATALEYGLHWAKRDDALLVGLGVVDAAAYVPVVAAPEALLSGAASLDPSAVANASVKIEAVLSDFALRCAEAGVSCKVLEDVGDPVAQVCREAERYDLVLLGRQTYFAGEEFMAVDPVLAEIVKHSPRPVVTVGEKRREGKCTVVAYDGSLPSARALFSFVATRMEPNQDVVVVSIAGGSIEAGRTADRAVDFLTHQGYRARSACTASNVPSAELIRRTAVELDAGLLVMGAFGRPGWKEWWFGSTTRSILKDHPMALFMHN